MELMVKGVDLFNEGSHGSSDYYKDHVYVMKKKGEYAPLSFMNKKVEGFDESSLLSKGFIYDALELVEFPLNKYRFLFELVLCHFICL